MIVKFRDLTFNPSVFAWWTLEKLYDGHGKRYYDLCSVNFYSVTPRYQENQLLADMVINFSTVTEAERFLYSLNTNLAAGMPYCEIEEEE